MKKINLPIAQTFSITIDMNNVDLSKAVDMGGGHLKVPLGNLVDDGISAIVETARKNGGKILYATTSIEQKLEATLLEYFVGSLAADDQRSITFETEILQSSALSFRAKKDLVAKVINEAELLAGNRKNSVQGHLKKIMEWRNAFAHGKIKHDSRMGCYVSFYSGHAQTQRLTDDFWDGVEQCFRECDALLSDAINNLRRQDRSSSPASGDAGAPQK